MIDGIIDIIGKFVPDKTQADKMKAEIEKSYNETLSKAVEADVKVRMAEMQSDSWLQSRWRPIAALIVFFAIFVRFPLYHLLKLVVGYFDLYVYLPELEPLPMEFYGMATAFISIYAYGRSQEKRFRK